MTTHSGIPDRVFHHYLKQHERTIKQAIDKVSDDWNIRGRFDDELLSAALDALWEIIPWLDSDDPPDNPTAAVRYILRLRLNPVVEDLVEDDDRVCSLDVLLSLDPDKHEPAYVCDPADEAIRREAIEAAMSLLTERQRGIVTRWRSGKPYRTIATEMGISLGTVHSEISAILHRISMNL